MQIVRKWVDNVRSFGHTSEIPPSCSSPFVLTMSNNQSACSLEQSSLTRSHSESKVAKAETEATTQRNDLSKRIVIKSMVIQKKPKRKQSKGDKRIKYICENSWNIQRKRKPIEIFL
ncbi:hypothetical protein PoB_001308500 [Plakobranchus ocellatus]|uniref:Uncharacterized protein n=1 Tax=Plakobranchus ocellatus TaxID=259542 RepID=A0AAV3YUR9_9GAST|nr:hypothetical protein PoB_001308500 [Plakobranchus ocellatus]